MPTQVQYRRGTSAQHTSFTGATGEITVDTDRDSIVVHDGSTAGGFAIPNWAAANATYKATTGVTAASYGSATNVSVITVDTYGRITYAANVAVSGMDYAYANTVGTAGNNSVSGSFGTTSNVRFGSFGVGTAPSNTVGEIRATNNITAYYSDGRLKTIISSIPNPIDKIKQLSGVFYYNNEIAANFGYGDKSTQVGVIAQEVEKVLPMIVKLAPFDTDYVDGVETSKSGENYKTVQYEKIIPLLIEAIKEQDKRIEELEKKLKG